MRTRKYIKRQYNHKMDLGLRYCTRCIMPESQEGQEFDSSGVCNVCRSSEDKMQIDWKQRRADLERILSKAKDENQSKPYDCIVPISGGKDSTFQLHVLVKEFGMRPLAVTFSHNWFSSIGMFNLLNALEIFDVDHIMFTPKRSLVNRSARRSLSAIGDACWHCHAGVGAFPLRVALDYGINLLIWGESAAESSSRGTYSTPITHFDESYFTKISAKLTPEEFSNSEIPKRELSNFETPTADAFRSSGITGIHLGDFIYWDEERQTEFVVNQYGWKEDKIEGTYKGYKSAECIMPGVHDFACYLKRGFGRTSFHLSADIRSGLIARENISEELMNLERTVPETFQYYSEITGITLEEFISTLKKHRHKSLVGVELPIYINESSSTPKKLFISELKEWIEQKNKE